VSEVLDQPRDRLGRALRQAQERHDLILSEVAAIDPVAECVLNLLQLAVCAAQVPGKIGRVVTPVPFGDESRGRGGGTLELTAKFLMKRNMHGGCRPHSINDDPLTH